MDISAYQHMNIRMSTRGKRPLRNLTPSDKVRAIQRIHNGETKASVSRDIGVPESTLRGWCKNEQKLRFMCRQMGADHVGVSAASASRIENLPSEKRAKYDNRMGASGLNGFPNMTNFENMGFNRLPLNPMDFGGNNSALLSKFCMNSLDKQKHMSSMNQQPVNNPLLSARANAANATTDCTQLPLMQNPNLLALLNSNLWSSIGAENIADNNAKKLQDYLNASNDYKTESIQNSLAVKNWAKDFSENIESKDLNRNDTNNNDLKSNMPIENAFSNTNVDTNALQLLFPHGLPVMPNQTVLEQDRNNVALLEWCKMFNASINFLALAAAAASLKHHQQQQLQGSLHTEKNDSQAPSSTRSDDNLLYKHLTQAAADSSTKSIQMYNDLSNDCAYESEPEDLSLRSTTSKLSSPAYSRSDSPVKSNTSRSSLNSDE